MHMCSSTGRFADVDKVKKKSTRDTVIEEERDHQKFNSLYNKEE